MPIIIKCSIILTLIIQSVCSLENKNSKLLYSEQEIVDTLVKKWAPLVWLAPNEKFLPGDVKTFLSNVHAERERKGSQKIKDIGDNLGKYSQYYQNDGFKDLIYYEEALSTTKNSAPQNNRRRRNFDKGTKYELFELFELPIDEASEDWFLVTNEPLENLIKNEKSFIYGEDPLYSTVPIYAVVTACVNEQHGANETSSTYGRILNEKTYKKNPYIPLTKSEYFFDNTGSEKTKEEKGLESNEKEFSHSTNQMLVTNFVRRRRSELVNSNVLNITDASMNQTTFFEKRMPPQNQENVKVFTNGEETVVSKGPSLQKNDENFKNNENTKQTSIPHFHVTYWFFYPFSQGKTVCILNLGLFGPFPIPLVFNICLGNRVEYGNHVGDWEHFSLFFKGTTYPDEMYVSAHDSGAFYRFDELTGTFEFKSQETRKGYFQKPTFPRTVITNNNHPVLFSAKGSHGIWAAPGKHKFVRVPRLYDVLGFGKAWKTWENVEIIYNNLRGKRSLGSQIKPSWYKYRGRWGNPKTGCHPLTKIGLHVCEQTDGPSGIPKKTDHFTC